MNEFPDDNSIGSMVSECLHVMKGYPTLSKMTACYNLTERILRLFTIRYSQKEANNLMDEFCQNLKKEIIEMYWIKTSDRKPSQNEYVEFPDDGNFEIIVEGQYSDNCFWSSYEGYHEPEYWRPLTIRKPSHQDHIL